MATTKKRPEVARSEPADAEVESKATPQGQTYRIVLREGASYGVGDLTFVRGRVVLSTDPRLYERLRSNGRFAVDVVKKGVGR